MIGAPEEDRVAAFTDHYARSHIARARREWNDVEHHAIVGLLVAGLTLMPGRELADCSTSVCAGFIRGGIRAGAPVPVGVLVDDGSAEPKRWHPTIAEAHGIAASEAARHDRLVVLAAGDPITAPTLSGLLRAFDRPDLAVAVTTHSLASGSTDTALLVARGAALVDLGEHVAARRDLEDALGAGPNRFALAALSRLSRLEGDLESALERARDALQLVPCRETALTLASAARAAGSDDDLDRARALATILPPSSSRSRAAARTAAEAAEHLIETGRDPELAIATLETAVSLGRNIRAKQLLTRHGGR